ncbi:uncharacterized protein A4U43_C07F4010 [Asparagus officinalis]|uniref:Pulmonary surfactant-associated protein B n=1 Tax=Asparagus officinalis TaxID=4686 RepID=A0A5P1E9N6_ASPOF|nr:prosaposin-like [Asparagus officinalis]ONK62453.1 uncharacterized protein A4U43_C07F4010 [Asparagus officinalis]
MSLRRGCLFLFVMVVICVRANARNPVTLDIIATSVDDQVPNENENSEAVERNGQLCTLCQDYTTQVVEYFSKNETQYEIISTLHQACSLLHVFKHQCVSLADHYAPMFFSEIATIQPELFCKKLNLCKEMASLHLQKNDDVCNVCHHVVREVLTKLQDPDTQLEIIETLLKGCNKMENFARECKQLVFEYGPIVLANAEKFFETTDICAAIHVCKANGKSASLGELLLSYA